MSEAWIVGSINIDTTYCVSNLPIKGSTILAKSTINMVGGKGANQAASICNFKAKTNLIGSVGNDNEAKIVLKKLTQYNIDISYVSILHNKTTGSAVILVDKEGANIIVVNPGANQYIPKMKVPFKKGDFCIASLEINLDAVNFYFKKAKMNGCITMLNPSPYRKIPESVLKNTDIIIANEVEASLMSKIKYKEEANIKSMAKSILKQGVKTAIITLGKDGAALIKKDKIIKVKSFPVKVLDTQGAGDAFLGAFVAALINGKSENYALKYANIAGGLCVSRRGSTMAGLPKPSSIERRMNKVNIKKVE